MAAASANAAEARAAQSLTPEERRRGALLGLFIGDALSCPVHWYYDLGQLRRDFGSITGYAAPKERFPNSIMNLSNTGGGGRGGSDGDIIGTVINHGKKHLWLRGQQRHYHHGLPAGGNTLEAHLLRLIVRTLAAAPATSGAAGAYLPAYVEFMTTPDSHPDVYASTCHRMFFKNWVAGVPPAECADNDGHNVDTIDALTPAVPVLLAGGTADEAAAVVAVNRKSSTVSGFVKLYADMLAEVMGGATLRDAAVRCGSRVGLDVARMVETSRGDPMVACYLRSSFPALLHFAYKYPDPTEGLLASANAGGENVARSTLLGALYGASTGVKGFREDLVTGLHDGAAITLEVDNFMAATAAARPPAPEL